MSTKAMLAITLATMLAILGLVGCAQADDQKSPSRFSWGLGLSTPSGGASEYYGSSWFNLRGSYRIASTEKSEQLVSLGLAAGMKTKDFYVSNSVGARPTADYTASVFSISYEYRHEIKPRLYVGGGIGLLYLNTRATYDAGEGYVWTATGDRDISLSKTSTALAPHLAVGYEVRNRLAVELGVTVANATLAGNTSEHSYLPSVPDVKLGTLFTLSVCLWR